LLRERLASYPWSVLLLLGCMALIAVQAVFTELDRVRGQAHRQLMGLARILYGQLRQPPRPGGVTLTPPGLHYEQGNSLLTAGNDAGPREAVHLEAPEYGVQRLFLLRDGRRFEIGPGLTKPEREWLAEVLRQWVERGPLQVGRQQGGPRGS
jgi:hypothetical protein